MTDEQIEEINEKYNDYCKKDGHKLYHLPFIIWLKQVAKINPKDYYGDDKGDLYEEGTKD